MSGQPGAKSEGRQARLSAWATSILNSPISQRFDAWEIELANLPEQVRRDLRLCLTYFLCELIVVSRWSSVRWCLLVRSVGGFLLLVVVLDFRVCVGSCSAVFRLCRYSEAQQSGRDAARRARRWADYRVRVMR